MNVPGDPGCNPPNGAASEGKRMWLTGEEFRAQIEAQRIARLREKQMPKKPSPPRIVARVYILDPELMYEPKPKPTPSQEGGHE